MIAPWKRQRFHYNWSGSPKIIYPSFEVALLAAKDVNSKRLYTDERLAEPYICRMCSKWHIGRSKQAHKDTTLWHEIGDRAYYNLISENTKTPNSRMFAIFSRFKFLDVNYGSRRLQLLRLKSRVDGAPLAPAVCPSPAISEGVRYQTAGKSRPIANALVRELRPPK